MKYCQHLTSFEDLVVDSLNAYRFVESECFHDGGTPRAGSKSAMFLNFMMITTHLLEFCRHFVSCIVLYKIRLEIYSLSHAIVHKFVPEDRHCAAELADLWPQVVHALLL